MGNFVVLPVQFIVGTPNTSEPVVTTLPTAYRLHQNYPNPFNPTTTIRYELKNEGLTRLRVYNLTGQSVADLLSTPARPPASTPSPSTRRTSPPGCIFYRPRKPPASSTPTRRR